MPRTRRSLDDRKQVRFPGLVAELVAELRNARESGQPVIEEIIFPGTKALRVTVVWDKWDTVPDKDRAETVAEAYRQVEGDEFRSRISLLDALTVPEAVEAGLLPYRVLPLLRKGDPVTAEQCREAMLAEGGSTLASPDCPQLCFATEAEAAACVRRLVARLPASEQVWAVTREAVPGA
jgi:hypothetical protein